MKSLQTSLIAIATLIEKASEKLGRLVSWLTLMLVLLVFIVVIMRYLFNAGSIPFQETIIYLHGMIFLLGAAYTLGHNEHVRVDVFYASMNHRKRAWVDLIGSLLFLFPVCIFIFSMSLDYVLLSWRISETSGEAGGLTGLYWLKSLLLIMPVLMMLQGLAWIIRCILFLITDDKSPYITNVITTVEVTK